MEIYTDDAGVGRAGTEGFIMGMWLTWRPLYWRSLIRELRNQHRYPYRLHFSKIGTKWEDGRYRFCYSLLRTLAKYTRTWYYRGFYVAPEHYPFWQVQHPDSQAVYDWALRETAGRFLNGIPENDIRLVVEQRNRPPGDTFIPTGLEALLNNRRHFGAKQKSITVDVSKPEEDDLLQVADFLTSAVRCRYIPGTNKCKYRFADASVWHEPIASRMAVWEFGK